MFEYSAFWLVKAMKAIQKSKLFCLTLVILPWFIFSFLHIDILRHRTLNMRGRRPGYASASLEDGRGHSSRCGFSSWTQRWLLSQQGAKDNMKTYETYYWTKMLLKALINLFNPAYFPPTPNYSAKPFWKHNKWRHISAWSWIISLSHIWHLERPFNWRKGWHERNK